MSRHAYLLEAPPPLTFEAVEALAEVLREDAEVPATLGGTGNVFDHEAPETKPASGRWIVVRERVDAGGRPESNSGTVRVPIQVALYTRDGDGAIVNVRRFHERLHDTAARAVIGRRPLLEYSEIVGTGYRRITVPQPALYFEEVRAYVSVSEFALTLKSKQV